MAEINYPNAEHKRADEAARRRALSALDHMIKFLAKYDVTE